MASVSQKTSYQQMTNQQNRLTAYCSSYDQDRQFCERAISDFNGLVDTGSDDLEIAWKELQAAVNSEKWNRILRERLRKLDKKDNILVHSNLDKSDLTSSTNNHITSSQFLRSAIETSVSRGNVNDVRSLFQLTERYGVSSLVDEDSMGGAWVAGLMAEAVTSGRVEIVTELMKNNGNPNQEFKDRSHLSRAIALGSRSMVKHLLAYGADPNKTSATGKTALHEAAASSGADVINCLLDFGAEVDVPDKIQGNTPLHTACSYCNGEAVFALYDRGVEFNAPNNFGDTPLAKLLRPLTKAENFHNSARIDLAKALVKVGFIMVPQTTNKSKSKIEATADKAKETSKDIFLSQMIKHSKHHQNNHVANFSPCVRQQHTSLFPSSTLSSSSTKNSSALPTSSPSKSQRNASYRETLQRVRTAISDSNKKKSMIKGSIEQTLNSDPSTSMLSSSPESFSTTLESSQLESLHAIRTLDQALPQLNLTPPRSTPHTPSTETKSTSSSSSTTNQIRHHQYHPHHHRQLYIPQTCVHSEIKTETKSQKPKPRYPLTQNDRIWAIFRHLSVVYTTTPPSLQQRCRLVILSSMGTRPLVPNLDALGLPSLVTRYLRTGGRECRDKEHQ